MSASFAASTSAPASSPLPGRRPSRTRTLLTGWSAPPAMGPRDLIDAETTAGPNSAGVRAALDEMSLVLPATPSPEAARLPAFESARRLVQRDAMELQSGIAVASDETLDCVLEALRSAEGIEERAIVPPPASVEPAVATTPSPHAPARDTHATSVARDAHATSVMQAVSVPADAASASHTVRVARPRQLRTMRIPPALSASALAPSAEARATPRPAPRRAAAQARGRGLALGALAALGITAGAALAWLSIGTPQVLARSAPGVEMVGDAR